MNIAKIIVDITHDSVDRVFDYLVPDSLTVKIGQKVKIPFGRSNKQISGYCIEKSEISDTNVKLKEILGVYQDYPILNKTHIELLKKMVAKFNMRHIDAINLLIPSVIRNNKTKKQTETIVHFKCEKSIDSYIEIIGKRAFAQVKLLHYLIQNNITEIPKTVLVDMFSLSVVNALEKKKILKFIDIEKNRYSTDFLIKDNKNHKLTESQEMAKNTILKTDEKIYLLKGVTGSGKTEVYLQCISEIIDKTDKTAIFLVPEISLTPQTVSVLKSRFKESIGVIHSQLSVGEKYDEWLAIFEKKRKIVVGPRSAIFSPIENVGIIVIDEEHDESYFSQGYPNYDAFSIAQERANIDGAKIVLGSATPSISTFYLVKQNKIKLIELNQRINKKPMPHFDIIDMRDEIKRGNNTMFSNFLISSLLRELNRGNQAILFLNRRGFYRQIICSNCKAIPMCAKCDSQLIYHQATNNLKCHYCLSEYKKLTACDSCGSNKIKYHKRGTQGAEELLAKHLGDKYKILRLDRDSTSKKGSLVEILKQFDNKEAQVLIGTQMVVKGHDFPDVSLVGIIDADLGMFSNNYLANEKTFQLITQVAGRCGRADTEGHVILQTSMPRHSVIRQAINYDYDSFYFQEINLREVTGFPPFSIPCRVLITSKNNDLARKVAVDKYLKIKKLIKEDDYVFYFQGSRPDVDRINEYHRYEIVMRIKLNKYQDFSKKVYDIVYKDIERNVYVDIQNKLGD